jgi:hypothetical protein
MYYPVFIPFSEFGHQWNIKSATYKQSFSGMFAPLQSPYQNHFICLSVCTYTTQEKLKEFSLHLVCSLCHWKPVHTCTIWFATVGNTKTHKLVRWEDHLLRWHHHMIITLVMSAPNQTGTILLCPCIYDWLQTTLVDAPELLHYAYVP